MANFRAIGGGNVPVAYKTIATSAANQTYAAQLTELKATYDTLTDEEKLRTVIYVNDGYIYNLQSIGERYDRYSLNLVTASAFSCTTLIITTSNRYTYTPASSSPTDESNVTNNTPMYLMLLCNY